jgi:hypothetical protein
MVQHGLPWDDKLRRPTSGDQMMVHAASAMTSK